MSELRQLSEQDSANRTFFNRWARDYDTNRLSTWFRYTQQLAFSAMDLKPESYFLDIGCGTGWAVLQNAELLKRGKSCGIDISDGMIQKARMNTPDALKERVEFKQASADDIPYSSSTFDYLLCTNSFHHYQEPGRALKEMMRVLKPSGRLVILDNAPDLSLYAWAWDRFLRIFEKGHVRYYRSDELGTMIAKAGFVQVRLRYLKNEILKNGKLFASLQVWSGEKPDQ